MPTPLSSWVAGLATATAGATTYRNVVIQDGVAKQSPAIILGRIPALNVTASRVLTLSDSWAGILATTIAGPLTLTIPTEYRLGSTFDPNNPYAVAFLVERWGAGSLFVNPAVYRGAVANQAAMVGLAVAETEDWVQRVDAGNQVYILTGADKTNATHWTAVSFAAANRPRIFWGAVANQAAMVALSNALPGDWVTRTDLSAAVYELQTAPYSTAGNWSVRTDEYAPTTPQIRIVDNDLDPQYLTQYHGPILISQVNRDFWRMT